MEATERYADGLLSPAECRQEADAFMPVAWMREDPAWRAVSTITGADAYRAARVALQDASLVRGDSSLQEESAQAELLRCLGGNPFRPVSLKPAWLTADVVRLAHAAYDERQLPSGELNRQRLQVLADALEDAGCANADVLGHLRGPGVHVRGCWMVDLLTGRE